MFPACPGFEPGLNHMFPEGPGLEPGWNHVIPAGLRFGRNSAPPGSFRDCFCPSEPRLPCATSYISHRPGPQTGQKRRKGGFSRSWGPFWVKRPPTKFDRMLNADPVNPVWGPMCPWGPSYGRFGGAGGHFVGWGPVLSVRDQTKKNQNVENRVSVAVPRGLLSSKTERFSFFSLWCPL